MNRYIMALDQGTTSSRAILFDKKGNIVSQAQKEFTQYYPHPGWVEHDAVEIWESVKAVATESMAKAGVQASDIAGIGIANQRETSIVWDRETGIPIYPAIVWQCRRTAGMIDGLDKETVEYIRYATGLVPDAYFSATKLEWILNNVEGAGEAASEGRLMFGTVDTWLIWKLSGGKLFVTDYSNASRTMLFDIHNLRWDKRILKTFNIPESMLASPMPSGCVYGETDPALFGQPIPIAGAAGDQQAALFGQCCFEKGDAKNTYGTGCFLLMNTGSDPVYSKHGLVATIAASLPGETEYALEGSVFSAGSCIQWLRDELKIIESAGDSENLALSVPDTGGVYIVPAFTGLGAPWWNQNARGIITGITRGTGRGHLARAALESIAYQSSDVLRAMEKDMNKKTASLRVDGGASANNFLMQFQADILGADIIRPSCTETTALGAAYLAGLSVGYWNSKDELLSNCRTDRVFVPEINKTVAESRLSGWHRAVEQCVSGKLN